jgi:hypothetical protein
MTEPIAMAAEAGVLFLAITGSSFVRGCRCPRGSEACSPTPAGSAIIFIDEIDAIGGRGRGGGGFATNNELEHTLNQMLAEPDLFRRSGEYRPKLKWDTRWSAFTWPSEEPHMGANEVEPTDPPGDESPGLDYLDEQEAESFPSSDPHSDWAGPNDDSVVATGS